MNLLSDRGVASSIYFNHWFAKSSDDEIDEYVYFHFRPRKLRIKNRCGLGLWEEDNEYVIVDCESYLVASKIGIVGTIILIVTRVLYYPLVSLWGLLYPGFSLSILTIPLNAINFIGNIFQAVGFVGIFSMKEKKIGILFPLMFITYTFYYRYYFYFAVTNELLNYGLYISALTILSYTFSIIGGLLILSIRTKTEFPRFVTIFAFVYAFLDILADVIWLVFSYIGGLFSINSSFQYLFLVILSIITILVVSLLTIKLFQHESKQGCLGDSDNQVVIISG